MLGFIVATGLAMGSVYALIGITYNIMFTASRVISFTAGQLGMIGGVLGSLFILEWHVNVFFGFLATLLVCAVFGLATELVAVRPVLSQLHKHLYVLSTLALSLMLQNFTAITWGTEPRPFPQLFGGNQGSITSEKFWLPVLALAVVMGLLQLIYQRSLVGRAFLAVAEDNIAGRALGLPERTLRMTSFALAGAVGGLAGFAGGQLMLAFFVNGGLLAFYGFVAVALSGLGRNWGVVLTGLALGLVQQTANFMFGGVMASVVVFALFIIALLIAPQGFFGRAAIRQV